MLKFSAWDQELDYDSSMAALATISEILVPQGERQRYPSFPWGNPVDMLDYNFDYKNLEHVRAAKLRQIHGLYRKFEPLVIPGAESKTSIAFGKFLKSEEKCKHTNLVFDSRSRGKLAFRPGVEEILLSAQHKIRDILGPVPKLSQLRLRFGPGGTTTVSKKNASVTRKLGTTLACSEPLIPYLSEVLHELPAFCDFEGDQGIVSVEVHPGKLTFVPKDAKQYRSVVTEPVLSGMCQLGIGDYMKRLLLGAGLDIRDQDKNQVLARIGSLTGDLATLDLSSASDLVSKELVAFLLPVDWWSFLKRYRSSSVSYEGDIINLEKFSSMGNGYTFALETLIFYALSWAACPKDAVVRAYGDDIIVPTQYAPLVIEVLESCGFDINMNKSFWEGPFRESCGADYLSGINIRPYYFDTLISCENIFSFHNFLVRNGEQDEADKVRTTFLDESLWIYGPDGFGDGHLVGCWGAAPHKRDRGWSGYVFETYSWKAKLERKLLPGDRHLPTYSIYMRHPYEDAYVERRSTNRKVYKVSFLRTLSRHFRDLAIDVGLPVHRNKPHASLPGKNGYKRIKIYTLVTPDYIL